jgi:hypothetical protein
MVVQRTHIYSYFCPPSVLRDFRLIARQGFLKYLENLKPKSSEYDADINGVVLGWIWSFHNATGRSDALSIIPAIFSVDTGFKHRPGLSVQSHFRCFRRIIRAAYHFKLATVASALIAPESSCPRLITCWTVSASDRAWCNNSSKKCN